MAPWRRSSCGLQTRRSPGLPARRAAGGCTRASPRSRLIWRRPAPVCAYPEAPASRPSWQSAAEPAPAASSGTASPSRTCEAVTRPWPVHWLRRASRRPRSTPAPSGGPAPSGTAPATASRSSRPSGAPGRPCLWRPRVRDRRACKVWSVMGKGCPLPSSGCSLQSTGPRGCMLPGRPARRVRSMRCRRSPPVQWSATQPTAISRPCPASRGWRRTSTSAK